MATSREAIIVFTGNVEFIPSDRGGKANGTMGGEANYAGDGETGKEE